MADKGTILELGNKLDDNMNEVYVEKFNTLIKELEILKKAYKDLREVALELAEQVEELKGSTKGYEEEIAKLDDTEPEPKQEYEHKFKVGDKIKFVGKLDDHNETENGTQFIKDMLPLLDREPREILSIDYEYCRNPNTFEAELEGIIGSRYYHKDDFEKVEE